MHCLKLIYFLFVLFLLLSLEDPEAILKFACHLMDSDQLEESLALWRMYSDCAPIYDESDSIALSYLLGERIDLSQRKNVLEKLESLSLSVS